MPEEDGHDVDAVATGARIDQTPGTRVTAGDRIRLVLPAEPDYGRIARIAASSVAVRIGFAFGEIEDLRLAVDEAIIMLLRPDERETITVDFQIEADSLVIDLFADGEGSERSTTASAPLDAEATRRFDEIVAGTVDVHEVDAAEASVHLVKRYHS